MDFQVLASCKQLAAAFEATGEGLFACVNSDVVDQLVFRFERLPMPAAVLPVASVVRLFRTSDVFDAHMGREIGDMVEELGTGPFP